MKYLAVIKIFFKLQIIYRFDVLIAALGTIWRVVFAWVLWSAVFMGKEEVGGFTFQAMMSYYLINSFLISMDMSGRTGAEVNDSIVRGTFSKFMVVPANPQFHFLSQNFGTCGYYGLFAAFAAAVCVFMFKINLAIAADLAKIILALVTFILGIIFLNSFRFFIGLWAFKYHDIGFVSYMLPVFISFFKGEYMPLSLLAEDLNAALRFFPFTHASYTPALLLMGRANLSEGLAGFGVLAVWSIVMLALNQFTYNRLRVKYEGVGI